MHCRSCYLQVMKQRRRNPEICFWKLAEAHETTTYTTIIH